MKLINYLENIDKIKIPDLSDGKSETIGDFFNNCIKGLLPLHDTIYAWDKLLNKYVNEDEVIFFIRKYSSDPNKNWNNIRRGFYTKYCNDFGYVYCDNFFAHYFYLMAVDNYIPEYNDFYQTIMDRKFPYGFMETSEEIPFRAFNKGKNIGINKAGWKLAHVFSVNGNDYNFNYKQETNGLFPRGIQQEWIRHNNSAYPYREIKREISINERNIMKAHFLRLANPINYFLVPKHEVDCINNNIGEYSELIQYVYLYNRKYYFDIFEQYEKNVMYKKSEILKTIEELGDIKINVEYGLRYKNIKNKSTNGIIVKEKTMHYNSNIVNDHENLCKSINYNGKKISFKRNDHELFQDFVKKILNFLFNRSLLSEDEIVKLQSKEYSKKIFGLELPLLEKDINNIKDKKGHSRYWTTIKFGGVYFGCKEWWRGKLDIYEPKFADWMNYIFENNFKKEYKNMVKVVIPIPNIKIAVVKSTEQNKNYSEINPQETIDIKGIEIPLYKSRDEITQDFVKKILYLMFKNNLLPESEIKNMLRKDYCKETFGIGYAILNYDMVITNNLYRTWVDEIFGYYVCSQWWKQFEDLYKIKISNWIRKVKRINDGEEVGAAWDKPQDSGQEHNAKTTNSILIKKTKDSDLKEKLSPNNKHEILNRAFDFMLPVLPEFIGNVLQKKDKNTWWQNYVLNNLPPNAVRDLPKNGMYDEYINKLDISLCLKTIIQNWQDIFKHIIKNIKFSWVHELIEIRNDVSHWSTEKSTIYTFEFISHTLNVMKLFMSSIDTNVANQISEIKREFENKYKNEN
jgi:hypothetical protein